MHMADWLPTLMGLASGGAWQGPLSGLPIDGVDVFAAVTTGSSSPRSGTLLNWSNATRTGAVIDGSVKYVVVGGEPTATSPLATFALSNTTLYNCQPFSFSFSYSPFT